MQNSRMSKQLQNMLTEFFICEIKSRALDGITYAMFIDNNNPNEKNTIDKYKAICEEVANCGYRRDEIFRGYKIGNGYIFDMDMGVAKSILMSVLKAVQQTNGDASGQDIIGDSPDRKRKSDMLALAKYIKNQYDSGKDAVEVALFNRNYNPKIMMTAKTPNGESIAVKYNAYSIRHWDIEIINEKLLIPAGIRVATIEPCEVLPSKNGVTFILYLDKC